MLARLIRDDEGMTLTELLVTSTLLLVVLASAWMLLNTMSSSANAIEARQIAEEQARTAVERTGREIRQAVEIVDGQGAFVKAEPREAWVYIDVDYDGYPELVRYAIVGSEFRRQVVDTSATPPASLADFTSAGATQTIAESIDASWTGAMFTYWSNADPPVAKNTTTKDEISSVEIRFVTKARRGQETVVADENTWIKLRSVFSNLD